MRYRTRVFVLLAAVALMSGLLVFLATFLPVQRLFFDLMRTNVLSIAATCAAMIDSEAHETIQTRADQNSAAYSKLERQLRKARDANRRDDVRVKFLYSMRPAPDDPKTAVFVVDAEERLKDKSNVGEVYRSVDDDYVFNVDDYHADERFVKDQWGTWLTANAPIIDDGGRTVGAIGADISAKEAIAKLRSVLWLSLGAVVLSVGAAIGVSAFLSDRIARPLIVIRDALREIGRGDFQQTVAINSKDEFGEVAGELNRMTVLLQQREDLKSALARYVSADVLEEIIVAGRGMGLHGRRKKVTILFADVRGFTSLSEEMTPEATVELLNDYFEKMIEAVFKNHGNLNKFMGDGLMALFGALREDNFQEEHAVQAALDMRQAIEALRLKWSSSNAHAGLAALRVGIGVNTGLAIVGNIGSKQRMEFTAIGDSVNIASRLETMTKQMPGAGILVSEYTYVAVRNRFPFVAAGTMEVRGKADTIRTYTVNS